MREFWNGDDGGNEDGEIYNAESHFGGWICSADWKREAKAFPGECALSKVASRMFRSSLPGLLDA